MIQNKSRKKELKKEKSSTYSDFSLKLKEEDLPLTYEISSPKGGNINDYFDQIRRYNLFKSVTGVNVTNNPVGEVHVDPVPFAYRLIEEFNVNPILHLKCSDSTISGIQRWLLGANSLGINNLLVMSGDSELGDYPRDENPDNLNSLKILKGIKNYLNQGYLMPDFSEHSFDEDLSPDQPQLENETNFTVGAVIVPGRSGEANYAAKKIQAGADFFQTQITYNPKEVIKLLDQLETKVDTYPSILIGVTPLSSKEEMEYIENNIPQVNVPKKVKTRLIESENFISESIQYSLELSKKIREEVQHREISNKIGIHIVPGGSEEVAGNLIKEVKSYEQR